MARVKERVLGALRTDNLDTSGKQQSKPSHSLLESVRLMRSRNTKWEEGWEKRKREWVRRYGNSFPPWGAGLPNRDPRWHRYEWEEESESIGQFTDTSSLASSDDGERIMTRSWRW
ncbi:hypothetical protein CONPUDRAFT_165826 [Coniophora puteana RWD-64-598 SS2]|uniref:Uncharacterized protein n=1 Tax=Coniophora puteana (strain RWD-64-598) TaxID=741705 RepID=A0A5M3MNE4_CONPW|nr:uncharacterized protein CONPUDRAFT_165826 [Coniophora puteana RWD-64-598 SS2]EIW80245.1 hypothetical protein CONPUDRAFT_165826 [Coniophora puteana RWD-64-598 SS2]